MKALDAILRAADERGRPLYDERTVNDFLALVALALGPGHELSRIPTVKKLFAAVEREVPGKATPADRLDQYFKLHPLPPRLMSEVQRFARELMVGDPGPPQRQAAKVTGASPARRPADPKPAPGSMKGVSARLAARGKAGTAKKKR